MKMKIIASAYAVLLLASCGQKEKPKEMYCGIGMSAFEVIDAKTMASNFKYTDADRALLDSVTAEIGRAYSEKEVKVYFYNHKPAELGVYVVGPDDKAVVEKIACTVLQSKQPGLPKLRKVVFYTDAHSSLVAAVKTKPAGIE